MNTEIEGAEPNAPGPPAAGPLAARRTASRMVADLLRAEIKQGALPPGARLRQEDVAKRLQVSTTPVREAFQLLQAEGLLTVDPHRGAIVFRPTADDVRETYEIREALETLAVARLVERATPEGLDELQALLDEMAATGDDARWVALNHRFHGRMYELAGRPRLAAIIENLTDATAGYMRMVVLVARHSGRADAEHQEILDALRKGDADDARRAVRTHLHHTVEHTLRSLESPDA